MKEEFISEDDRDTFEGYLRYQGIDAAASTPEELATWRGIFDDVRNRSLATPKVGVMKRQRVPSEHLCAVAVREDSDLWLALWVRRSWKGDRIVMVPRGDSDWDVHSPEWRVPHEELPPKNAVDKTSTIDGCLQGFIPSIVAAMHQNLASIWSKGGPMELGPSWMEKLRQEEAKTAARRAAHPWKLRLERMRGKVDYDGVERVTTQGLFDVLEVPQRRRTAGACRRLAAVMTELGWTAVRVRGLTPGGYKEQVRGYCRDARHEHRSNISQRDLTHGGSASV